MSKLPRIPRDATAPPRTIVLPSWLTPGYARRWLKRSKALGVRPKAGQAFSQAERYKAIAERRDWDPRRGYKLVWQEPYAGRAFAQLEPEPTPAPVPLDEGQAARRFGELAQSAIMSGRVEADRVNAILVEGKSASWAELVRKLEAALKPAA